MATLKLLIPGSLGERIQWQPALLDALATGAAAFLWSRLAYLDQLRGTNLTLSVIVMILQSVTMFLFASCDGLYSAHIPRRWDYQLLIAFKAAALAALAASVLLKMGWLRPVGFGLLSICLISVLRLIREHFHQVLGGNGRRNVLIVGAGRAELDLADELHRDANHERRVVGFLDDASLPGRNILGGIRDLARVARADFVDEVIVGNVPDARRQWVIEECARNRLNVTLMPQFFDFAPARDCAERFSHSMLLKLWKHEPSSFGRFWKRACDVTISGACLITLAPVLAAIAAFIRLDSRGPIFYRSARAGRKGCEFRCLKFRTMVVNADELKEGLRDCNERSGPFFKIAADPRITKVGRWLRRYSLDELPQLWNVLRGQMSLVGPRPHPLDDCRQYRLEHLKRLDVTPGITGLWQVTARSHPSFQLGLALDIDYIEHWSVWLDLKILFKTVGVVFSGSGA